GFRPPWRCGHGQGSLYSLTARVPANRHSAVFGGYANLHPSNTISSRSVACPELFEFSAGPCHLAGKQWKRFNRFASSPLSLWKMTERLLRSALPSITALRQL